MFAVKKKKDGTIEVLWTIHPILNLINFFSLIDAFFSKKIFYLLPTGLGIGFGIGLVIFSQPATLSASNSSRQNSLSPISMTIPSQNLNLIIEPLSKSNFISATWPNHTVDLSNWKNHDEQFVIGTKSLDLEKLKLGDTIKITASNQGIYTFQVTHTKEIESHNINHLKVENDSKLIVLKPSNLLGTKVQAVLAK